MEVFEALDQVAPGANSRHTLLYGVEVKFYSSRIALTNQLETKFRNFFAIGDGAALPEGLSRPRRPEWWWAEKSVPGKENRKGYVNDSKVHKAGNGKNLG